MIHLVVIHTRFRMVNNARILQNAWRDAVVGCVKIVIKMRERCGWEARRDHSSVGLCGEERCCLCVHILITELERNDSNDNKRYQHEHLEDNPTYCPNMRRN